METKAKTKSIYVVAAALAIIMLFSSCKSRMVDFTVISTKNVSLNVKKDTPRVVGKKASTIKGAIDNAIESAGAGYDALVDGVVYSHYYYFILYSTTKYHVEGTPIKTSEHK